jgi:AcrR family transcriptional regulator
VFQPAWVARTARTRADIVEAALTLFNRDGFDAVTVDQIAAKSGISRRTFFRYFPSKEAVLFSEFTARQALTLERLHARPQDEAPLESLVEVLRSMCDEPINTARSDTIRRIVAESPDLRDSQQRIFVDDFARDLAHELSQRNGGLSSVVGLRAIVTSAVGCIEVATMTHLRDPSSSVRAMFEEAVEACRSSWIALP